MAGASLLFLEIRCKSIAKKETLKNRVSFTQQNAEKHRKYAELAHFQRRKTQNLFTSVILKCP